MGEKKLVPRRRFKGFGEEWDSRPLSESANILMGHSPKSLNYTNNPEDHILVQGNADIKNNRVIPRLWTTEITQTANSGDIILTVRAPVGEVAKTDYNVVLGRGVSAIKGNEFLFQYLLKLRANKYWNTLSTGSTFDSINSDDIKGLTFVFPNKKEQQKIGQFFQLLDNRIENQEQKITKVKALKSAYLTEMFPQEGETAPKRRFKGFDKEWEMIELNDIGSTFTGLSGKTKKDFGHGTAEFLPYLNVFNNTIANVENTEKVVQDNRQNQLQYGDILFTISSETPEEVGMSSVWLDNRPNVYLNSFCFGFRPRIKIDNYFIGYFLRANYLREQIIKLAQGISRYNLSMRRVMDIPILIPSLKEQQKIGLFFKNLDEQIETEERKLAKLKSMKEAYLEEMFV